MSVNFRYPNITGRTEREQLDQMKSYLHQMVEQLNFAMQGQGGTRQAGTDGRDGRAGKDGKTPQRGVDYWTEEDVQIIVNAAILGVLKEKAELLESFFPKGSIYISVSSTNPKTLFGFGTWTRIQDRFLLAAGSTYAAGSTGGEAAHTLTVNELPEHTFKLTMASSSNTGSANTNQIAVGKEGTTYRNSNPINSVGGGKAHNNMPPYLAVYVWQRTA